MVNHVQVNLVTAQKAVNDDGVMTIPLARAGGISELELTLRATTGAGGSASYGLLSSITRIEIGTAHGLGILDLSATELYRLITLRDLIAPQLSEGTGAGAVQIVKLPIRFGVGGDTGKMGLDMSKYPDCSVKVYYTLVVSDSDGFVSKSLEVDLDSVQTDQMAPPNYQGRIRAARWYEGSTRVQNPHTIKIKDSNKIVGIYAYAYKSGTADNALVRNIALLTSPDNRKLLSASMSDLQERRRPLAGAIIASWVPIWVAPGLLGEENLEPLGISEIQIELEELVADGSIKVYMEDLHPA